MRLGKSELDGKVETMVLAILAEGPGYGYQLVQDLNARGSGLMKLGEGTVYPVLHRLEGRGLIAASWSEARGGRKRKYYRLTPGGRRALADGRAQWRSLVRVMSAVLGSAPSGRRKAAGAARIMGGFQLEGGME